ncbi:m-phase inducer phosphatase [Rhodotorula kratochvilovae]
MLSSSPRTDALAPPAHHGFPSGPLLAPSSPTAAYHDGEISPSFDASFASSMSITSDERPHPSPLPAHLRPRSHAGASSPVDAMDISPAPAPPQPVASSSSGPSRSMRAPAPRPLLFQRPHSSTAALPLTAVPTSKDDHPFLKSLFKAEQSAPATQTTFAPIAPLAIPRSSSPDELRRPALAPFPSSSTVPLLSAAGPSRPSLPHYATVPPTQADKLRPPFQKTAFEFRAGSDGIDSAPVSDVKGTSVAPLRASGGRSRSALPSNWSKPAHRQTAPAGGLAPPPFPPTKRKSDSCIPTLRREPESSPFRMDVDGESPNARLSSPDARRPPGHPRSVSDSRAHDAAANPFYVSEEAGSSPNSDAERSGADERLADMFGLSPGDNLSPIPQSRKRFLEQENSPTPASPTPLGNLGGGSLGAAATRRAFEKAASTASLPMRVRRQRSAAALNARPSLNSFASLGPAAASSSSSDSYNKRHAAQAQDGKPAPVPMLRASRRSNSVADPSFLCAPAASSSGAGGASTALCARDLNIPLESPGARAPLEGGSDYLSAVGRRIGASVDLGKAVGVSPETGSPIAGFRKQEAKGKVLPCFGVKEDGLMRITPRTLNELQSGMYRDGVKEFIIVDCRFDYEYDGGHIDGAINLSELADVEARLLNSANPPPPSTSDCAPAEGKTVLIFHCEFSAKRAPTSAKHLRNQDRQKNFAAYPNIYYPELYILQGGYEAYYKAYPERCLGGYVVMDHPEHDAKRSLNLNKFRDQKRVFNRASSFTFGQAQHASALLRTAEATGSMASTGGYARSRRPVSGGTFLSRQALEPVGFQFPHPGKKPSTSCTSVASTAAAVAASTAALSITEEDHEGDSSFGTNGSSPGGPAGGSPCPPSSKMSRPMLKLGGMLHPRRGLERAATASVLTFSR